MVLEKKKIQPSPTQSPIKKKIIIIIKKTKFLVDKRSRVQHVFHKPDQREKTQKEKEIKTQYHFQLPCLRCLFRLKIEATKAHRSVLQMSLCIFNNPVVSV